MTINELNIICNSVDKINSIFEFSGWSNWGEKLKNEYDNFDNYSLKELQALKSCIENIDIYDKISVISKQIYKYKNPRDLDKMIAYCILLNQANCVIYSSLLFALLWKSFPLFERNYLTIFNADKDDHVILSLDKKLTDDTIVIDIWAKDILKNEYGFVGKYADLKSALLNTNRFNYCDFKADDIMTEICRNIDFLNIESEVKNGINKAS